MVPWARLASDMALDKALAWEQAPLVLALAVAEAEAEVVAAG
jgi:hypothetical protein